jgi:RNA polymerase sigma factor (sigma-70 family)
MLLSSSQFEHQRQELNRLVAEVLNGGQDDIHQILPFIAWKLQSFRLRHQYDPCDIFLDAYDRAMMTIERGEPIRNIPAWFKSTTFNIIREYDRKAKKLKTEPLEYQQIPNAPEPCIADEILEARLAWLLTALGQLKTTDQEILHLRMQGMTYEEIALKRGGTVAALRQQVSRLLKQLRQSARHFEE